MNKREFSTYTGIERAKLIEDLNSTDNIEQFLQILLNRFDMKNCKPGMITRKILASNMVNTVLPMLNPNEK